MKIATLINNNSFVFLGTKGFMGEPAVSPTYCPINGAYTFTYSVNDGTENSLECSGKSSEISDCPYGFGFNLKFRECSFGNMGKLLLNYKVFSEQFQYFFFREKKSFSILKAIKMISDEQYHSRDNKKRKNIILEEKTTVFFYVRKTAFYLYYMTKS